LSPDHARLLPLLTAACLACGGPLVEPLAPPPDFAGVVKDLRGHIMEVPPALYVTRADGDVIVYLPSEARVYRCGFGGVQVPVALDVLTPGIHVQVWTTGVELRSLPPQYTARQIVAQ
jgi:hypothetical protein